MAGNGDLRKSASSVASAYGGGTGSMYDEQARNPFGIQNWEGYAPWRASGSGGGLPLGGGGSSFANSPLEHAYAPAFDFQAHPNTLSGWQQFFADMLTPKGAGKLASLVPLLGSMRGAGGGSNPFSSGEEQALVDEIRRGLAIQRQRLEQTQPVFDDLVRRTQAYAPNATYGGPAYDYRAPRFGG